MSRRKGTGRTTPSSYRSNNSNGSNGPAVNPETITFFHRSLDRNDVELAAIDELNSTLHSLKTEILNDIRGEMIILQLGEGTIRLFKPTVTIVKNTKGPPPPDAEPPFPPRLDDTPEAAQLSTEMKKVCVEFLERMLLRRKLLNRLFRRLLRVSATMDTTDGSSTTTVDDPSKPPPAPRYGDDRLQIDPTAAQTVFEKVQKQTDALLAKMNPDKAFTPQEAGFTPSKDDTLFLDYKQLYDRLLDPEDRTNVLQFLADANVTADEWSGTKVGAIQRNLTSKEKEAEYHRWQAALWARIPLQPTFSDLGSPVFELEARKEAAAKAHKAKLEELKAAEEEEKGSEENTGDEDKDGKSTGGSTSKADDEESEEENEKGEKSDENVDEIEEDAMHEEKVDKWKDLKKAKEDKEAEKGENKESKSDKEKHKDAAMEESGVDKRGDKDTKSDKDEQDDEEKGESEVDNQKDKGNKADEKKDEEMEESEVDKKKSEGEKGDEDMDESEADEQKDEDKEGETGADKDNDDESETSSNIKDTESDDKEDDREAAGSIAGGKSSDDKKAATEGENGDKTQENSVQKIVRPISLVPVPSFYEQDWKRIKIVQADLMSASMQDFARRRTQEVIAEYNSALRKSNSLNDRRAALQNQLTSLMQENKNFAAQFERNYKMQLDNAQMQWNQRRQEFESARLNYLMPHRNNPHHRPNGTALTKVYSGQPDPARRMVAYCVGDIVDTAIAASEGQFRLERFQEAFHPPHKESLRNNESYIKKKTMEERLKTEYTSIVTQLRTSEDERQRAWKRMMKTKAEFEIPHQMPHGRVNVDMTNYNLMPLPTLKNNTPELKHHQHTPSASMAPRAHVPSTSRLSPAAGTPMPSRPPNPSMPMNAGNMGMNPGTSDSKYSAARVRERISSDGTVAPVTTPKRTKDGLFVRPAGRTRKGMDWDAVRGIWVPNPNYSEN